MIINFLEGHEIRYTKEELLYIYLKNKFSSTLNVIQQKCKKKNIEFNLTVDDLIVPSHCPVLGIELNYFNTNICDDSPSIDRIVPDKGYVVGNVEIISMKANRIKSNGSYEEITRVAEYIKFNT